ncbi:hypothetical protein C8R45DRAFT_1103177 [Mycena sanguinolenta]|nr:hypothetical protein C8R45DRAFT_1103177 [Mycena sanguinolenta]
MALPANKKKRDTVIDPKNPHPTIDRAASTRSNKGAASSSSLANDMVSSGSAPTASGINSKVSKATAEATVLRSPYAPRPGNRLSTPTTSSRAKESVAKTLPKKAASNASLPSHMAMMGFRGPRPPMSPSVTGSEPCSEGVFVPAVSGAGGNPSRPLSATESPLTASPPTPALLVNPEQVTLPVSSTDPSSESDMKEDSLSGLELEGQPRSWDKGESITAGLASRRPLPTPAVEGPPRFFNGLGHVIDLYDEPLMDAVVRHHVFDSAVDPDPLMEFGVVDGELPDCDPATTLALRDAVV